MDQYQQQQQQGWNVTFADPLTRATGILLAIFAAVFALMLLSQAFALFCVEYLALDTAKFLGRPWQAVTSIFLHAGVLHLLGNMIFFWFFGTALARSWGDRQFLLFFFTCGVVASLCFYFFNVLRGVQVVGLGASGGVFGLMIAYAMIFGERTLLVFLIPMKAKYFVAILFSLEILLLWAGMSEVDGIAHIAHVGGAIAGAAWIWTYRRRQDRLARGGGAGVPAGPVSRFDGLEVMQDERKDPDA